MIDSTREKNVVKITTLLGIWRLEYKIRGKAMFWWLKKDVL